MGGGELWTVARDGRQADACHSAPCVVLLWTGGASDHLLTTKSPRVLVDDDSAAHNFGLAVIDGALLAAGGLYRLGRDARRGNVSGADLYARAVPLYGDARYPGIAVARAPLPAPATGTVAATWAPEGAVVAGDHPGCVERRDTFGGLCEFDGRLSLAKHRGAVLLYARANTAAAGGGGAVQVASRAGGAGGAGAFGPFRPVTIDGLGVGANVYYGAVSPNPADGGETLLGLFPTVDSRGVAYVGLGVSCDGAAFSRLEPLLNSSATAAGRASDQPADGLVDGGDAVYVFVHRDVPGIARHSAHRPVRSRLVRLDVPKRSLAVFSAAARGGLPESRGPVDGN